MEVGHHVPNPDPRVPIRNWRVILDKIGILLVLAALQDATEAWCLDLVSPRQGRKSMETLEDYYAEVISSAMPLRPLQSKEAPTTSARVVATVRAPTSYAERAIPGGPTPKERQTFARS